MPGEYLVFHGNANNEQSALQQMHRCMESGWGSVGVSDMQQVVLSMAE